MAPDGPALIDFYRERIAELGRFVAARDLLTIPAWLGTINVQETPKFMQPVSPGASMVSPRLLSAETNGYYFITPPASLAEAAARLDMNQDFRSRPDPLDPLRTRPCRVISCSSRSPGATRISFARSRQRRVRRRVGLLRRGDVCAARAVRERSGRAAVHGSVGTGARSPGNRGSEAGFRGMELRAGGGLLCPGKRLYPPGGGRGRRCNCNESRLFHCVHRRTVADTTNLLSAYIQKTGGKGSLHDFHDRLLSYGSTPLAVVGPELLADLDKPASAVRAAANY